PFDFGRSTINLLAVVLLPLLGSVIALDPPSVAPADATVAARGAERVVVFAPFLSPYLTIDQGEQHIVAVAPYLEQTVARTLLGEIFPQVASLPVVSTVGRSAIPGDPEEVLRLHPDAVITWAWFSDALAAAGLPLVGLRYDPAAT